MQAESAGEEAVSISIVQPVARAHAGGRQAARNQLSPGTYVPPGVADYRGFPCGTGRGVYSYHLFGGNRKKSERIVVP